MNTTNKIVVGLELNYIDSYILNYLKTVSFYLKPEEIKFVNIHKEELPDDIVEKFPELVENIDDHFIKEMVEETANFSDLDTSLTYQALQGAILEGILNAANEPDVDLLVIGRKNEKHNRMSKMLKSYSKMVFTGIIFYKIVSLFVICF